MKQTFKWDGEKIVQSVVQDDVKHSPKDILNGLDGIRNQINQMKGSETQLEMQMKTNKNNLKRAIEDEKRLVEFEEKCIEIQKNKLNLYIEQIKSECEEKALKDAKEVIAKDSNAYNEGDEKKIAYLNYQKLLATNEKIAEKIAKRIITECLYTEPIFKNPFKD